MKHAVAPWAILLAVCGSVFFFNLGSSKLWDRDEPRNAGCAQEMMDRSDWVTPVFNDELREQKPVLLYWLIMSAYSVFGVGEFGARFWSAALASGTCVWVMLIGRRLFGRNAGLMGGVIMATCLMFDVAGRAATPDSVLVFCGASAIGFWVLATFRQNPESETRTWSNPGLKEAGVWFPRTLQGAIPVYAAMGLGVLAKGPVGFVLPVGVIGFFNLLARLSPIDPEREPQGKISRRLSRLLRPWHPLHFAKTTWSMRPLTAFAIVLLVAAPWYVWVGLRTEGDFLVEFFLKEHFGRATTAMENHSGGIWFYPVAMLMGTFPWSIFTLPLLLYLDRSLSRERDDRSLGLILGATWIGLYLVVFTIAETKLPSYITPCYPGFALIAGRFVMGICDPDSKVRAATMDPRWWLASLGVLGLVGVLVAIGVPLAAAELLPGSQMLGAIGLVLIAGAASIAWLLRSQQWNKVPWAISGTAIAFSIALFGFGTVTIDRYQQSTVLLDQVATDDANQLASFGVLESSWVFYAKRPIFELRPQQQATAEEMNRQKMWKPKPRMSVSQYLQQSGTKYILTTDLHLEQLREISSEKLTEVKRVPYFLNDEELVLLRAHPRVAESTGNSGQRR